MVHRDRIIRVRRPEGSVVLTIAQTDPTLDFERAWWAMFGDVWHGNEKELGAPPGAPHEEREDDSRTPRE